MSENFRDYLIALRDDPDLRDRLKKNPGETLADARISKEEKLALRSGDLAAIKKALGGLEVPKGCAEVVGKLGRIA